jgi:large subunit ribosomal protein L6
MSRIGRLPIKIPAGVTVAADDRNFVTVRGPLGALTQQVDKTITFKQENGELHFSRTSELKEIKAKHGLYRALIANMVTGVVKGFTRSLVLNGVGYKVAKNGQKLVLNVGYSHPIEIVPPAGISFDCPAITEITVKGIDKTAVGQCAAMIRAKREPEPYHGYGIRYSDEVIKRKEGKTAGK